MAGPAAGAALGNRIAPARFLVFLVLLVTGFFGYRAVVADTTWQDALAMAFDFAAALFLLSLLPLLRDSSPEAMRKRAAKNDAGRVLVLVLTMLATVATMAAITGELEGAQSGELLSIAKLVVTLLLIWLFANTVYTLHYAHAYYAQGEGGDEGGGDRGGLDFPGTRTPDYADFAYFAFTLGMTFQTSDVEISDRALRHAALLHSFGAFVFNIGVIAFTINVLGGG